MTSRAAVQRRCWETPLRRLKVAACLEPADEALFERLVVRRESYAAAVTVDFAPPRLLFLVSGWACSLQVLADGRRQILALLLPGDVIARPHGAAANRRLSVRSITAVQTCETLPMAELNGNARPLHQGLFDAARRAQDTVDGYVFDQVVRLGALSAYERVGDLFLEIFDRLQIVGQTNGDQFLMPLTQEQLGELLGLSETHVNRMIRQLRQDGLLGVGPGWFALPDRERLAGRVGRFAPVQRLA